MDPQEPVYSIGRIVTSAKVVAIAVLTLVALVLDLSDAMTVALISIGSGVIVLGGDIIGYVQTRKRVTPWIDTE